MALSLKEEKSELISVLLEQMPGSVLEVEAGPRKKSQDHPEGAEVDLTQGQGLEGVKIKKRTVRLKVIPR